MDAKYTIQEVQDIMENVARHPDAVKDLEPIFGLYKNCYAMYNHIIASPTTDKCIIEVVKLYLDNLHAMHRADEWVKERMNAAAKWITDHLKY